MYFLFLAQTHTRYSTARKPIKFACRENKPLLFSRDDQSTVNRLHLPHLSLFLRAEKQQFRRSLNDNKGTIVHFTELWKNILSSTTRTTQNIWGVREARVYIRVLYFPGRDIPRDHKNRDRAISNSIDSRRTFYFTSLNRSIFSFISLKNAHEI